MNRFSTLIQTCEAYPSQWEGTLKDGRHIYIRYRWGNLGFGIGKTADEAVANYDYGVDLGDEFHGELETEEMLKVLHIEEVAHDRD